MRKTALLIIGISLWGSLQGLLADPAKETKRAQSCEEQLAAYLTCPDVLKEKKLSGIVVIQFQVNADSRLAQLEVFSADERLNASLIRQLTGKKVNLTDNEYKKTYTVRLHFRPTQS
ncbi:hypothetical protein GCM10023189_51330 [Nibrella saemangeumensis]|uniref:TonB C-terminal domain-containing protein n=1 Tax=Nibrella saemangeumensis TaxID=1084526 RepID=A0ABP8NLP2_9BACT